MPSRPTPRRTPEQTLSSTETLAKAVVLILVIGLPGFAVGYLLAHDWSIAALIGCLPALFALSSEAG